MILPDYLHASNEEFKDTESRYRKAVAENDNDAIFKCFHRYCHALTCKHLKNAGLSDEEIYEKGLDATIDAMKKRETPYNKALGGMHYDSLQNWCYWSVIRTLYPKQLMFEERMGHIDDIEDYEKIINTSEVRQW